MAQRKQTGRVATVPAVDGVRSALKALEGFIAAQNREAVPSGWLTVPDLAAMRGVTDSRMYQIMRHSVKSGLFDTRLFRIDSGGGQARAVKHYKVKQK